LIIWTCRNSWYNSWSITTLIILNPLRISITFSCLPYRATTKWIIWLWTFFATTFFASLFCAIISKTFCHICYPILARFSWSWFVCRSCRNSWSLSRRIATLIEFYPLAKRIALSTFPSRASTNWINTIFRRNSGRAWAWTWARTWTWAVFFGSWWCNIINVISLTISLGG